MKFLCPSCKTKYQIADEKVTGRAVRMKCRKCGYVIPISQVPPAPATVQPSAGDALPPVPKLPPPPRGLEPPPSSRSKPGTASPTPPPKPSPPPAPVAAKPTLGRFAPRPAAARPVTAAPAVKTAPKVEEKHLPDVPSSDLMSAFDDAEEQPTAIVSGGALAAAFGALVTAPRDSKAGDQAMPADEWYVGINDVPVGPIRLGELRAKAASGAIQGDSLVWRDGLEEWRPLKTFPELVAVVEESLSSVRASGAPLPAPGNGASRAALSDFGTPLPSGVTSVGVVTDDLAAAGLTRTRTPVAAWIAIAMALVCGIAIGVLVIAKQKPPETVVKYVDRVVPGTEQPAAVGAQSPAQEETAGAASATDKPRTSGPRTGVKPVTATATDDKGGGLSGLKGLDGLRPSGPGPGTAPGTTTPGGSGGGQLDAAQIQGVVSRYTGSVKRSCWQPALDSRDPSAPPSARVSVTINVAGNGSVQSVSTSGDPRGYPGLANCIAGRVRSWQFPATGGSSTAVVPFVFAAQ